VVAKPTRALGSSRKRASAASRTSADRTFETWVAKIEQTGARTGSLKQTIFDEVMKLERHLLGIAPYKPWRRRV
jgi:hypothetical protein